MKKRLLTMVLLLICMTLLTGCFCKHETWMDATCTEPKTCAECGKTEGEPLGHVWMAATCEEPKTCEQCGLTDGEPKGHDMVEASCTEAKHCTRCTLTEGEALGHDWIHATTELPQTCATCNVTEGERIITDPRFTTAAVSDLLGTWACELELNSEAFGIENFEGDVSFVYFLEFGHAGDFTMSMQLGDEESFMEAVIQISIVNTYAEFEAQGISKKEADAAIEEAYGMSMEEYLRDSMKGISMNEILSSMFSAIDLGGVYYVEDGKLYMGMDWDEELEATGFTLDGDWLIIDSFSEEMGFEAEFYRVPEE